MRIFAVIFFILHWSSSVANPQETGTVPQKPVELAGDLNAIALVRASCDTHIKEWSRGRGTFLVDTAGRRFAIRAVWSGDRSKVEQINLEPSTKESSIDWNKPADFVALHEGPKQTLYYPDRARAYTRLSGGNALDFQLQVIPSKCFAHSDYERPWSQLMDPNHPECAKDCVYSAQKEGDQIIVRAKTKAGLEGKLTAKKEFEWLITEFELTTGSGATLKYELTFIRDGSGKVSPKKIATWYTKQLSSQSKEPQSQAVVLNLDLKYEPMAKEFSVASLNLPAGTSVSVIAGDGKTIKKEKIRDAGQVAELEQAIEAAAKEAAKSGFAAPRK